MIAENSLYHGKQVTLDLLRKKLEIIIITYNRQRHLEETLEQLVGCIFSACKIVLLDNCSTDNTYDVYKKYKDKFEDFTYKRNKINIGGNANIIRAFEESNGLYTWVLCDDDKYDFSFCDDVIDVILEEKISLIHMGAHEYKSWQPSGIACTGKELLKKGYNFFAYSSFVPCNLFKTEFFFKYIIQAYDNIPNWYPHLMPVIHLYENDTPLYVAKNRIVTAVVGGQPYKLKELTTAWVNTCYLLKKNTDRRAAFFDQSFGKSRFIKLLEITYFLFKGEMRFSTFLKVFYLYNLPGFLYAVFFLMLMLFIYPVYRPYRIWKYRNK